MKHKPIKFASPDVSFWELWKIRSVLNSGWLTNGPVVSEFETRVAEMSGCSRAVAFDSCTAAMEMSLRALGIGPGDEVITTPYTYSATAEVIRNVGATIVFCDLAPDSFEMDYFALEDKITEKTKAVIPVDIGGKLCDYDLLRSVLKSKAGLFRPTNQYQERIGRCIIIADAAHSFGASKFGRKSGEFADMTCFSFHVLKNITTGGEGGAVVWEDFRFPDNDELERRLRLLGDHGQTSRDKQSRWEYDIALFGYNHIMTNVDAAMGLAQLDRFEDLTDKRVNVTKEYDALSYMTNNWRPLIRHIDHSGVSGMHLYPIEVTRQVGPEAEVKRNRVYDMLRAAGIPCNVHYKPLPMMTAYKNAGFDINDYPNAYRRFSNILTIPYHTGLTERDQERIVFEIGKAVGSV